MASFDVSLRLLTQYLTTPQIVTRPGKKSVIDYDPDFVDKDEYGRVVQVRNMTPPALALFRAEQQAEGIRVAAAEVKADRAAGRNGKGCELAVNRAMGLATYHGELDAMGDLLGDGRLDDEQPGVKQALDSLAARATASPTHAKLFAAVERACIRSPKAAVEFLYDRPEVSDARSRDRMVRGESERQRRRSAEELSRTRVPPVPVDWQPERLWKHAGKAEQVQLAIEIELAREAPDLEKIQALEQAYDELVAPPFRTREDFQHVVDAARKRSSSSDPELQQARLEAKMVAAGKLPENFKREFEEEDRKRRREEREERAATGGNAMDLFEPVALTPDTLFAADRGGERLSEEVALEDLPLEGEVL